MADQITSLLTSQLQPNPFQPRSTIEKKELEELVTSVKSYGILEPLVIAHTPAGFQIIAGERRWRAAQTAGLEKVPVVIRETTPRGMLEMALVENVQRVDLSPLERAKAFFQLKKDFGHTNLDLADKIGKSQAYVSNSVRLLDLPDAIKDGLEGKQISEGHARALTQITDERSMIECYKIILKEGASVRRAEELSRRFNNRSLINKRSRKTPTMDTQVEEWRLQLQSILETPRSEVKLSRSKRQTKISFILNGAPEQTEKDLKKILTLRSFMESNN